VGVQEWPPMGSGVAGQVVARLWPHQREAVELVAKQLGDGGQGASGADDDLRAQLVMACGLGKTRVGMCLALGHRRVLVLAPTVILLTQTLNEYRTAAGNDAWGRVLVVCSDQQVGTSGAAAREDLAAQQVPVSTDPQTIAAVASATRVTVLATYASVGALIDAHQVYGLPAWDLVIADEAHRTTGAADRPWARVHQQRLLPARRRLYMTATPRVATDAGAELVGMDDERVFGPLAYRLGFSAAIDLGLLAPWRLVVATVTDADIRAATALGRHPDGVVQLGQAALPARMLAVQLALLRTAAECGLQRAISYHSRVADARMFAATLTAAAALLPAQERPGQVWARDLHGGHTAAQRQIRLRGLADGLAGGLAVLSNARLLAEGVDVPAVDAIVFSDPRASTIDIVQAIGRALRRGDTPGKVATVIVPLLTTTTTGDDDPAAALDDSAYAQVWRVIQALRAHDDTLAAELDNRRRTRASSQPGTDEQVWIPAWLQLRGTRLPEGFARAIAVRMVEQTTSPWEEGYAAATAYHAEHGHLRVPVAWCTPAGLPLGKWIVNQRIRKIRGSLTALQIARLETIGMIWDALEESWDRAVARAAAYRREHGHLNIPAGYLTDDGFQLGYWLNNQRTFCRDGTLCEDRRRQLDALGIDWEPLQAAWQRGLTAARAYHAQHGHLRVPQKYVTPEGFHLGEWITRNRAQRSRGKLSAERFEALDTLGMPWDNFQLRWAQGFAAARAYHAQHGHVNVPVAYVTPDGFALGNWIKVQRRRHKNGSITPEQIQQLEEIGMQWTTRKPDRQK
jgi:superfamily II DNA or RNA helicase